MKNREKRENRESKKQKKQTTLYPKLLLFLSFLATIILVHVNQEIATTSETIRVGSVALERYIAPMDAVDEVATEKLREAAANSVAPIYKNDMIVEENSSNNINEVLQELDTILANLSEDQSFSEEVMEASLALPVAFTKTQLDTYEQLYTTQRNQFKANVTDVITQIYSKGVSADGLEEAKTQAYQSIQSKISNVGLQLMAYELVSSAIEPNLVLDEDAMEAERTAKREEVADLLIRKNQKIVDQGEIVTEEIYNRLEVLGLLTETEDDEGNYNEAVGKIIIVTLLYGLIALYLRSQKNVKIRLQWNEQKMLFCIFILMLLLLRFMVFVPYFTLIPMELFAMLISALIGRRIAFIFHTCFAIVGCIMFGGAVDFLMYAVISGFFGASIIQSTEKRSQTIPVGLGMAAVNFVARIGVGLVFQGDFSLDMLISAGLGAAIGLASVIVTLGSLPFWEEVFEANTPLHLLEWTNPNNELLRRMMIETPGTYHHSLLVANLAETAVYAIGGNTALARAAAYYHDVGKLKSPLYFSENQSGYNPHDDITPEMSAKIITSHTTYGYKLGVQQGVPKQVLNIMTEHHGNSLVKYFYFKALKEYGAENVNEADYRYSGNIPQTKESAVIMLADTTEAAVRAMIGKGKTIEETEDFVKTLIKDKLDDGQLDESQLGIHELQIIRKAFMEVFHGMYHERIQYPDKEEMAAAKRLEDEKPKQETLAENDAVVEETKTEEGQ
ncbi:MAG: HDIG domain-containing protein [Bacillota bacterium]